VSDEIYDACCRELKTLEEEYPEFVTSSSPTKIVGTPLKNKSVFQKKKHF
jgi:NAD-dependent DNA ligase